MKIHNFIKDSIAMGENEREAIKIRKVDNKSHEQECASLSEDTVDSPEEESTRKGRKKKSETHV